MNKIFTVIILIFGFQIITQAQIKVTSAAGTFDTLKSGSLIYYQYAWDEPRDELYPVKLKLKKPLKAFETFWDSILISDGSVYFSSTALPSRLMIVDATGWDLIDRGYENDSVGKNNISQITIAPSGDEIEWMNFGFRPELDTIKALPSNGSLKISIDTLNNVSLIYGDFAMVRPDLCFEGFGSLHPSITYYDAIGSYSSWFIHGNPAAPIIDTFSRIAFDKLPDLGQKIKIDFNKTNFIKKIAKLNIGIFPNPVIETINIQGLADYSGSIFQIISLDGRTVINGKVDTNKIGVQKLKSGNYILKISNKGQTYYARFIKIDY